MVSVPELKVTVDVDTPVAMEFDDPLDAPSEPNAIYCSCQSEYCDCGSDLGITEASARKVYQHLGFPDGREAVTSQGYRECVLHVWGTHNLSTEEILSWMADYSPVNIEWINDASCNIVFVSANTVLRIIADTAEPFSRRVALAAAAALASVLDTNDDESTCVSNRMNNTTEPETKQSNDSSNATGKSSSLRVSSEALDSIEEFSQYLPPSGRWYKALSVPAKTVSLFLRFAHKSDVKLPGAERRSLYYRRYGNPNYGGMTGILSRSYRRRLRVSQTKSGVHSEDGLRHVRILPGDFADAVVRAYVDPDTVELGFNSSHESTPLVPAFEFLAPEISEPMPRRHLVVYDNLYDVDDQDLSLNWSQKNPKDARSRIGRRREGTGFPTPKSPWQPRKWPRRKDGPPPDRWIIDDHSFSPPPSDNINVIDLREPWARDPPCLPHKPFVFSGSKNVNRKAHRHMGNGTITTITVVPDSEPPMSPGEVLDEDENAYRTRRLLSSMSMVADLEEHSTTSRSLASRLGSHTHRKHLVKSKQPPKSGARTVWQRLG